MSILSRLSTAVQATRELGFSYVSHYALYKMKLWSGLLRLQTRPFAYEREEQWAPAAPDALRSFSFAPFMKLPEREELAEIMGEAGQDLLREADEIAAGRVRLFGGPAVDLRMEPKGKGQHWTAAEDWLAPGEDIKFTWEGARLGWAFTLGRAYRLSGDERYAAAFWGGIETFLQANPPNLGLNWTSAQEAGVRILALCFGGEVFKSSVCSTPQRRRWLWAAIAAHARRIPPTLDYARAQNNNHLVTEALGLYTAGVVLADHPQTKVWKKTGRSWLEKALQAQISETGGYVQHSTNYHRLMLQAALWADALQRYEGLPFQAATRGRLAAATHWLVAQSDPVSGRVVNLGHNDGAHLLPLSPGDFGDYRPTLQAAARAFLGQACLDAGPWDESSAWLGLGSKTEVRVPAGSYPIPADVYRLGDPKTWATLRAASFHERPAHADQLHVDLWWQGTNLALDAGTFRYTAPAPWQNALARTRCHNTVEIDDRDQMLPAGRFLWLYWAQGRVLKKYSGTGSICAEHNGYTQIGVLHRRTLTRTATGWRIVDDLLPVPGNPAHGIRRSARLHWLFPDVPWNLEDGTLTLYLRGQSVTVQVGTAPAVRLIRAGEVIAGQPGDCETLGWTSPTYSVKTPALCLEAAVYGIPPLKFVTDITLPNGE